MNAQLENMRKACVLFIVKADAVLSHLRTTEENSDEINRQYLRLHSEAVTAIRNANQLDLLPLLMAVDSRIREAWRLFGKPAKKHRDDRFCELVEIYLRHSEAVTLLEQSAGLYAPTETRVFSGWYDTENVQKLAGQRLPNGTIEAMPSTTWQRRRKELGNQIENHPTSGARRVRLTQLAAEVLGIQLPEFHEGPNK